MITVLVKAHTPLSRAGLEKMIESDGEFVLAGSGEGGSAALGEELPPDIVLTEARPDEEAPWEEAVELSNNDSAVVILAEGPSASWAAEAISAGVKAVLPRSVSPEVLLGTLHSVAAGLVVFHADDLAAVIENRHGSTAPADAAESLTAREQEVLSAMSEGLSNKEIAVRLSISDHTVKFHIASIMSKLGATSRTEAVTLAIRRGLLMI